MQGTLLFTLKNSDLSLQDDELYEYFRRFGDIKVIRTPHFRNHSENNEKRYDVTSKRDHRTSLNLSINSQRFVEFYDSRDCVAAYDECHGQPYKDGFWDVSFFWDHTNRQVSYWGSGKDYSFATDAYSSSRERHEAFALKRERPSERRHDKRDGGRRRDGGREIPQRQRPGVDEFGMYVYEPI